MEDKRKRTVNFTSDEKTVLTELVLKYKDILENKKTDATTNVIKVRGWKRLCDEFNALSTHCRRTPESLKTCWENIKRLSKKQSASRKRELFKTGGGRPSPPPDNGADRIIETILGPALEGLENPYDGDFCDEDISGTDGATKSNPDDTQIGLDTTIGSENEVIFTHVVESEPSCSYTATGISEIEQTTSSNTKNNMEEENNKDFKWEGWTPNSLKRPLSEVLRTSNGSKGNKENNGWLRRRRPDHHNLSDQLIQEKINLVKTLILNAQEESKKRILILEEQLKQEKIKTQKLL